MTTFSAAGGRGLVGVAAFPLQCQWICTMIMFYPAPTDGRYSNGLRCLILLYVFNFKVNVFYILVTLVSVLLRPTTSLLWLILSVPMCIDVTMCMLMLLFYDSCAMLALYVSIKFLLTYYIKYYYPTITARPLSFVGHSRKISIKTMMTSWFGNTFRITIPLWVESIGHY